MFLRISSTDWVAEDASDDRAAWTLEDSKTLARRAHERGADLVDSSSGGIVPVNVPHTVEYQNANAAAIRNSVGDGGPADAVFLGRALLRDASWANNAAATMGAEGRFIKQYDYAV